MTVRVRFAPSPTGYLHVGGGRTALYNWLFARHHGGVFVLRADDTDIERSTPEFQVDILESLEWLGIDWDEGIVVGGPHGTYRQTDRTARYRAVAADLVASGAAYYDGATPEQLEQIRVAAEAAETSPVYDGRYRLSAEEAAARLAAGNPPPVRLAVPRPGETRFVDVVRGEIVFGHDNVDDFVILRSDGTPIYHLASTVDDVDYGITHVIRGEDILPSTPKHILITQAMGAPCPQYAHLSLLNGPDGKKLSKRHGDTAIRAYRDAGYLPAAVRNFLAILGWSPGTDEEIVSLETMIARFELGAVSRNPAVFDLAKLEWMNGQYLRAMSAQEFSDLALPLVETDLGRELTADERGTVIAMAPLIQERAKRLTEVAPQVRFLLNDEVTIEPGSWDKVMTTAEAPIALAGAGAALEALAVWSVDAIEAALRGMLAAAGLSAGKGLQPVRVAITGSAVSPPLFESLAALGRERSLARLAAAAARLA
ncbi:MAG TPA: glutamate--tRNA ligase [Actinobacteria bacterium]|nr:glutamate--tRNA ligase [Actinomycetota bacterium]